MFICISVFGQRSENTQYDRKLSYAKEHKIMYKFTEENRAKLTNVEKLLYQYKATTSEVEKLYKEGLLVKKDENIIKRNREGARWKKDIKRISLSEQGVDLFDNKDKLISNKPVKRMELFKTKKEFKKPVFLDAEFVSELKRGGDSKYVTFRDNLVIVEKNNNKLTIDNKEKQLSEQIFDENGNIKRKSIVAYDVLSNGEYVVKARESVVYGETMSGICYELIDRKEFKNIKLEYVKGGRKLTSEQFNAYTIQPNPAHNFIKIDNLVDFSVVQIFAINGKLIKQIAQNEINDNGINISTLNKGTYILRLSSDTKIINQKFIKI